MSWVRAHASAFFIFGIVGGSLLSAWAGVSLATVESSSLGFLVHQAGHVLTHFSSALVVAAIVAVFLSFRDVREQILEATAEVFRNPRFAHHLPSQTQDVLLRSILLGRARGGVEKVPEDLVRFGLDSLARLVSKPIRENMRHEVSIGPHPSRSKDLLLKHVHTRFRLDFSHLKPPYKFEYRAIDSCKVGGCLDIADADFLLGFKASFREFQGDGEWAFENVSIRRQRELDAPGIQFEFEQTLEFSVPEIDVVIDYTCALPIEERCYTWSTRHPCRGCAVELDFAPARGIGRPEFDALWLKSQSEFRYFPGEGQIHARPNGVRAETTDWVLPGEGIIINWQFRA
jgi:hypothetical protein